MYSGTLLIWTPGNHQKCRISRNFTLLTVLRTYDARGFQIWFVLSTYFSLIWQDSTVFNSNVSRASPKWDLTSSGSLPHLHLHCAGAGNMHHTHITINTDSLHEHRNVSFYRTNGVALPLPTHCRMLHNARSILCVSTVTFRTVIQPNINTNVCTFLGNYVHYNKGSYGWLWDIGGGV